VVADAKSRHPAQQLLELHVGIAASKPVHSGTDAAKVARLTTRPPQRSASSWRRGTSRRISSAPTAGRKVTTVSRPIGGRLIC